MEIKIIAFAASVIAMISVFKFIHTFNYYSVSKKNKKDNSKYEIGISLDGSNYCKISRNLLFEAYDIHDIFMANRHRLSMDIDTYLNIVSPLTDKCCIEYKILYIQKSNK